MIVDTYGMENQTALQNEPTKDDGVYIPVTEAEEYRNYKKKKKQNEIAAAFTLSESSIVGGVDVRRVCERAARLRQPTIKVPLTKMTQAAYYLAGSGVKVDCVVGGGGETVSKVKLCEARLAVRRKAAEITLVVTPSFVENCRYGEIRKELRKVRRLIGRRDLKVRVDFLASPTALSRVARIASEAGAKFFSVPYYNGCERLRQDLSFGCRLEVSDVNELSDFRHLRAAGVARIVTDRAWEMYNEWLASEAELSAPAVGR